VRIYKPYGAEAVQLISENPYRLARDIRGIGFRTADQIAAKLGIEKNALIRVRAGIAYALTEAMDEGHCGLPSEELISLTQTLLEVPTELVETALGLELDGGAVIADDLEGRRCVFLAGLYRAEREIAEKLKALVIGRPPWPAIDADKAIPWVEQRTKLALADCQREAVRVALASKVLVITGGPGVGKTTLVNSILKILLAKTIAISLCAPTGRAAKRLSESTGIEAKTIHRLLETDPRTGSFRRSEGGAARLRSAGRRRDLDGRRAADARSPTGPAGVRGAAAGWRCRSAAIGRTGASSGRHHRLGCRAGRAFGRDLPAGRRQAAESRIITNAHRINQGRMPDLAPVEGGTSTSSMRRTPRRGYASWWRWCRNGSPSASGSTRYATYRCSAR
jgi:exodeoxyribonuclease V alpha subunit